MLWLLLLGCSTDSSSLSLLCELRKPVLAPAEARPGETVVATTGPLTAAFDTAVSVGGTAAKVTALDRTTCDECDTCRDAADCSSCDECTSCATECSTCVETVSFTVPDLAPGATTVTVTNLHAASRAAALTVSAAADTGGDSGEF